MFQRQVMLRAALVRRARRQRRGVLLLVVLALLALFTLIGLTLVLSASQARLSSVTSARAQNGGTPYPQQLSRAFHDVLRGSTNKYSPIQAHSIVEDLYGMPLFKGQISGAPAMAGAGQLLTFAYTTAAAGTTIPNVLPNASYEFSGLVLTMTSGNAAGQSARIVRDTIPNVTIGGGLTGYYLTVPPFGDSQLKSGDEFVINGRPFSGTGLGFQTASFNATAGNPIFQSTLMPTPPATFKLDAMDPEPALFTGAPMNFYTAPQFLWPYALLPNHAKFTPQNPTGYSPTTAAMNALLTTGFGWYTDPGGPGVGSYMAGTNMTTVAARAPAAPGGANEPYDAVDYQNMFLAMHYFDTNFLPGTIPANLIHPEILTPIPSFHRPELIAHWAQRIPGGMAGAYMSGASVLPQPLQKELRRKVILRPEPQDQGFNAALQDMNSNGVFDYREPFTDLNGDGMYTPGNTPAEPFFDLNGDGVYTPGDLDFTGKRFNPITGPYCIYHNPTTGFETWVRDPLGDWDVDNDGDGMTDSIWIDLGYEPEQGPDGKLYKPLFAILCVDMDGKLNLNANGSTAQLDPLRYLGGAMLGPFAQTGSAGGSMPTLNAALSRNFQIGEAYGPAETNLLPLLERTAPTTGLAYYQRLLQGAYVTPTTGPAYSIEGRYGEVDNFNIATPDGHNNYAIDYLISGPMPGRTQQFDPYYLAQSVPVLQVNDPINQMMQSPLRPFLINYAPQQGSPYTPPGYFFDFITSQFNLTGAVHTPTGFSSPHNLHGRGAILLDFRGQPYYASTVTLPWMAALVNPIGVAANSLVNDTVDDSYELNLSSFAQRYGLRIGANYVSTIDAPFTPEEVERLMRRNDVDGQSLPSRLEDLAPTAATLAGSATKHALTSDSWDLPNPGVTATDAQQLIDLNTSANLTTPTYLQQGAFNAPLSTSLGSMSLVDLARARIINRNPLWINTGISSGLTPAQALAQAVQYADLALFGSQMMQYPIGVPTNIVQPLLSTDFLQSLRLDINRPLGDGVDNNGNGIVDEPAEVLAGLTNGDLIYFPAVDPTTGLTTYTNTPTTQNTVVPDLNNDGILPGMPTDMTFYGDARARQLLARHLYVLMMLLIDDTTLQGQIFANPSATMPYASLLTAPTPNLYNPLNNPVPAATPPANMVPSQQIAYFVAQWAINVVDFRDPDSICTPFEFDLSPFSDDDANPLNGTWDVNDIVHPTLGVDPWTNQSMTSVPGAYVNDDAFPYRGLVFGCERPELVISEIGAFHDRGTDDTNLDNGVSAYTTDPTPDPTYDQVRRPRGSLIVELLNPNSPLNAPQADLLQTGGSVTPGTGTYTGVQAGVGGVNLTQVVAKVVGATTTYSPVWRLAIGYSTTYDESTFYTNSPYATGATPAAVDPRVPFLPTTYIHRAVYFAPLLPAANAVTEIAAGRSFYVDSTLVGSPVILPPNSYALVGPGVVDPNNSKSSGTIAALNFGVRNKTGDATSGPNGKQNVYNMYAQMTNANAAVPAGLYNNYGAGSGAGGGGPGSPIPPYTAAGTPLTSQNIKPIVTLPIATLQLDSTGTPVSISGSTASTTLRMSVSEPELGYPLMSSLAGGNSATWDDNFYYITGGGKYPDIPFDVQGNANGVTPNTYASAPDRTTVGYTTVYLQRLANPTAFWDLTANPYITVDSMPVDLTTYTGEASPPSGGTSGGVEPGTAGAGMTFAFDARSRGQFQSSGELDVPNIWSPASTNPTQFASKSAPATAGTNYIPLQYSTLGYLNQTYWMNSAGTTQTGNTASPTGWQSGFYSYAMILNNTDPNGSQRLQSASAATGISVAQYWGDPLAPFPWLTWNNRPYVSTYEMMLVPASSPSSLLTDFGENGYLYNPSSGTWSADSGNVDPYNPPSNSVIPPSATVGVPLGAFHHLLNFYDSTFTYPMTGTAITTRTATPQPANFFRLFEYVTVPSRFTGTQKMLNPTEFAMMTAGQHTFHPPFNWLSEYREPGRVNLNTVFDPVVFQGIMDDFPPWIPFTPGGAPAYSWQTLWQGLVDSRRGNIGVFYNSTTGVTTQQNFLAPMLPNLSLFTLPGTVTLPQTSAVPTQFPIYPTAFANPLRPEGAATLAPPFISPATFTAYPNASLAQQPGQSINSTLLRAAAPYSYPDPQFFGTAASSGATVSPLLNSTTYDSNNQAATYSVSTGTLPSRQAARNAYFQYQTQSRLGNLTTNRSNVFAIWITVGYFEAVPVLPSAANPDGYQIGAEKGSDTGGFQRHRAFYMFDRSVPMGFTRGEDLNVDNGILVERVIE